MARGKKRRVRSVRISAEEYESMRETIDILMDREVMKSIARGLEDIREGRTIPHSEVGKVVRSRL